MISTWTAIVTGLICMSGIMAALWWWQRRSGDAGIVDVAWSLGVAGTALLFSTSVADRNGPRTVAICLLVSVWAIRLSLFVLRRLWALPEDGRYTTLKKEWNEQAQRKLFWFYQMQAAASVLFALPMLVAFHNRSAWSGWDVAACVIGIVAIGGESLADWQLWSFRRNSQNKGRVCRAGLWNYSRHPNYFFEWLHWWAYVFFAGFASWGWWNLAFPLAMLYFILFQTGIPPTEKQALQSRGDAYRDYQRTTSAFVPWFPKKSPDAATDH